MRGVQYVRMSTDHQQYSVENQSEHMAAYARGRGIEVVRTYADDGRSGLKLANRSGLQHLLADVCSGHPDFSIILVYDVSRWGRFQDADESAHYEFICRQAGIAVRYCAESFENDGSISSTIIKSVKRAMAAEFSRELSDKVFAGQSRLVGMGYRQGGRAGYGLRRALLDEQGNVRIILNKGEWKALLTDRVILVPGPATEVATVKRIYGLFTLEGVTPPQIAKRLNEEGVPTDTGGPWTRNRVFEILTNDKYIGHNVRNRRAKKLGGKMVACGPDVWVRADKAFTAIVDPVVFRDAQRIINGHPRRLSDRALLDLLSSALARNGKLTQDFIDDPASGLPTASTYTRRFGSLSRVYQLIGYTRERSYTYVALRPLMREALTRSVQAIVDSIAMSGGQVLVSQDGDLVVDGTYTASVVALMRIQTGRDAGYWRLWPKAKSHCKTTILLRLSFGGKEVHDYAVVPTDRLDRTKPQRFAESDYRLDGSRTPRVDRVYSLIQSCPSLSR